MEAQIATIRTHYDILGLTPDCTIEEVKAAHLQLTMLLQHQHILQPLHRQQLQAYLDESYQILSDADWRKSNRRSIIGLMTRNEALETENARLQEQLQALRDQLEAYWAEKQQLQETIHTLERKMEELKATIQQRFLAKGPRQVGSSIGGRQSQQTRYQSPLTNAFRFNFWTFWLVLLLLFMLVDRCS